ncbi:MAG: hypothetical protein CME71_00270 [Halobacteriovorax sp.]|nr:hypothetical protein [Halobacteriovorax sp.]
MVTATKRKSSIQNSTENETSFFREGGLLTITGTAFDVVGKIGLAIGITGVLLYLFSAIEAFIGLGVLYTGASVIAAGLASSIVANKLNSGFWLQGAFA